MEHQSKLVWTAVAYHLPPPVFGVLLMAPHSQQRWWPCCVMASLSLFKAGASAALLCQGLTFAFQGRSLSCCLHVANLGSLACWVHEQAVNPSVTKQCLHLHGQTSSMLCDTGL